MLRCGEAWSDKLQAADYLDKQLHALSRTGQVQFYSEDGLWIQRRCAAKLVC